MDELTGRLRRFVRARVSSREDAEDVIQEAYLRVLRYSAEHEVESQERLLFSAAKNLAVDNRRRRSTRERTATDYAVLEACAQSWPAADEVVYASQRLKKWRLAVAQFRRAVAKCFCATASMDSAIPRWPPTSASA